MEYDMGKEEFLFSNETEMLQKEYQWKQELSK